jgi:hypothetical protein
VQNATGEDSASVELSFRGRHQAEKLGKEWANLRIDHLYSSTLERALDTAREIHKYNKYTTEIEQSEQLIERYMGTTFLQYAKEGNQYALFKEAMGYAMGRCPASGLPRDHRPSGGGESFSDVARRGRQFVEKEILGRWTIPLARSLDSFSDMRRTRTTEMPQELEGIPHIVIVSHNVFLNELYEGMECWNEGLVDTRAEWANTGW